MGTLKGLNYDIGQEQFAITGTGLVAAGTGIDVTNTQGFGTGDYMVINPYTETSEIVKISNVSSNILFHVDDTPLKFAHAKNIKIYRLPYNYMRFYEATSGTGAYSLITGSGKVMEYDTEYTNFPYSSSSSSNYYKRTFFNQTTADVSSLAEADYFQVDAYKYPSAQMLRIFMQFDQNDYPTEPDMDQFMFLANIQIKLDLDTGNSDAQMLATLMKAREMVLRALANRAVSKGYIQVNAEGRTITKAHRELLEDAKLAKEDYLSFVTNYFRSEVSSTKFWGDTSIIDSETKQELLDIWSSVQNLMNYSNDYRFSYGFRQRRR